jgi:pilus assembly protein TadC
MLFVIALLNGALLWLLLYPGSVVYDFDGAEQRLAGYGGSGESGDWAERIIARLRIPLNYESQLAQDLILTNTPTGLALLYIQKAAWAVGGLALGVMLLIAGEQLIGGITAVVGLFAWTLPDARIKKQAKKARAEVDRRLPALLQALAMMTEAGMNLYPALSAFMSNEDSALGRELHAALAEVERGASLSDALMRMAKRCGVDDLYRAVAALIQAAERGAAGLTDTCRALSAESWAKRKDAAREIGQQASTKMFLPLMLLVLPALFLFMLGPAVFGMIHNF